MKASFFFVFICSLLYVAFAGHTTTPTYNRVDTSPSPKMPMLPECASNAFLLTAQCQCYLIFTKRVRTEDVKTSRSRCFLAFTKKEILGFEESCAGYVTLGGRIKLGKLGNDITEVVRKCIDPNAEQVRFVTKTGKRKMW